MEVSGEVFNTVALPPGNNPVPTRWVTGSIWELL